MAKTVVIVGGGTMGLSTAYWLSKDPQRYTSIQILDPYGKTSYASAGNDINKIIRTEYENPIYAKLAEEAIQLWESDPVFSPMYVKSGYLSGSFGGANSTWDQALENVRRYGNSSETRLVKREEFKEQFPWLGTPPEGFRGAYNGNGGWANAAGALERLSNYLARLDHVHFVSGAEGTVQKLIRNGTSNEVIGVQSADGTIRRGDVVVLAMGAWSTELSGLDYEGQAWPNTWMVTNMMLGEEEKEKHKDMSVFNVWNAGTAENELAGYCFPPHADGRLKVVANM
jgi:sarcosine oxidase/L-pipecolate oxidase